MIEPLMREPPWKPGGQLKDAAGDEFRSSQDGVVRDCWLMTALPSSGCRTGGYKGDSAGFEGMTAGSKIHVLVAVTGDACPTRPMESLQQMRRDDD